MGYLQYGISRNLVERVKKKLKNPQHKEYVKAVLNGVTKQDLQNRAKVKKLLNLIANRLDEPIVEAEKEA
ncbi:MAG TPA: stage VI sporulation protein F, partial [Bacilli bacterium]